MKNLLIYHFPQSRLNAAAAAAREAEGRPERKRKNILSNTKQTNKQLNSKTRFRIKMKFQVKYFEISRYRESSIELISKYETTIKNLLTIQIEYVNEINILFST
jgi:hypothetical protein